jgi:large subunit ribosomal protein L4
MAEAKVYDSQGNMKESRPLEGSLFNSEVKSHLLHSFVAGYLNNQRHGTASVKTRTGVSGGGKKPWRQKGTGRARSGSNTSPVWVGGGIAWGPSPKDWYRPIPKKLKRAALKSAFSDKAATNCIRIVELPEIEKPQTKMIAELLKKQDIYQKRVLILSEGFNDSLNKSCRNIRWLAHKRSLLVNPYDILWAEYVLLTPDALKKIEEVFQN